MSGPVVALTVVATLGSGVVAGVFFTFSAFVLQGLARLPAGQGVEAMQSINVTAVRPALMTALFGTAATCVALTVVVTPDWGTTDAALQIAGSVLYVVGSIGVTVVGNVPLNNALADVDPHASDAAARWADYLRPWSRWNHVRAVTAAAASVCFALALAA